MKLVISNDVAFDVLFTLNDAGKPVEFGFRAEAKRTDQPQTGSRETVGDYLDKRAQLRMTSWVDGRSPIEGDDGKPVAAGAEALAALYDLLPNMPGLVLSAYLEATGAKAKSGN